MQQLQLMTLTAAHLHGLHVTALSLAVLLDTFATAIRGSLLSLHSLRFASALLQSFGEDAAAG